MKKGLLLSIAASAIMFAGGDIQPIEPTAPASSDFWGKIGFRYQATDEDWGNIYNSNYGLTGVHDPKTLSAKDQDFGDEANNEFSAIAVLGVEKELAYGFGFGLELAGWTDFGLDIADNAGVSTALSNLTQTDSEVSQAYITYKYCNTAIKAGRQALPKAVSPWAWSDTSAGILDLTYEGVVVANTDLANTTLIGAWVKNVVNGNTKTPISDNGLFMLGLINKSFCDTTITLTGYYIPESNVINAIRPGNILTIGSLLPIPDRAEDIYSVWGTVERTFGDWTVGVQGAYVDGNAKSDGVDFDATYAVAAKVGTDWLCGDLHTDLVGWYINDGDYSLKTGGSGAGTSGFWGNSFGGEFNGEAWGYERMGARLDFSYKLWGGSLFGGVGYEDFDGATGTAQIDNQIGGRIGYSKKIMGIDTTIQYRYLDVTSVDGTSDYTRQKIRVEAYYKF